MFTHSGHVTHRYGHARLICACTKNVSRLPSWHNCNAPTGGVWPDIGEGVRLLGKLTGSYGEPETTRVSLVLRWMSKLGHCLTRQSKRNCSEATKEKAINDKPSTG